MTKRRSAKYYGELAQERVLAVYDGLPEEGRSWAAVAVALGLAATDKAAVNAVARKASAQSKVLEALGLPFDFTAVLACFCGCNEAAHCLYGRQLLRRQAAVESGLVMDLEGELVYETMTGQRIKVDLAQRGQRLGINGRSISAARLHDLFCGPNAARPIKEIKR